MSEAESFSREHKVKFIAKAFIDEDPEEYANESLEQVIDQISETSDAFIDNAFEMYGGKDGVSA